MTSSTILYPFPFRHIIFDLRLLELNLFIRIINESTVIREILMGVGPLEESENTREFLLYESLIEQDTFN